MFPDTLTVRLDGWINDGVDWMVHAFGDQLEAVSQAVLWLLVMLDAALRHTPWYLVILIIGAVTYATSRRAVLALGLMAAMFLIGVLGMWDLAMQTLSLMIFAIFFCVLIGVPAGIAMSRSQSGRHVVLPVLDAMQTMPVFVYLVPVLLLFGLGKVPALIATIIYATPPVIRLTDLGLRLVDAEILEASDAFGADRRQRLFGVQLPLALPTIMAGVNQTTMMALSMIVIASMIGARGLGEEVLLGISQLDVGRATIGGLAVVALTIVLDRVTQAAGQRVSRLHGGE